MTRVWAFYSHLWMGLGSFVMIVSRKGLEPWGYVPSCVNVITWLIELMCYRNCSMFFVWQRCCSYLFQIWCRFFEVLRGFWIQRFPCINWQLLCWCGAPWPTPLSTHRTVLRIRNMCWLDRTLVVVWCAVLTLLSIFEALYLVLLCAWLLLCLVPLEQRWIVLWHHKKWCIPEIPVLCSWCIVQCPGCSLHGV